MTGEIGNRIDRCDLEIAEARLAAQVVYDDPRANMLILLWEMDWLRERAELEDLLIRVETKQAA